MATKNRRFSISVDDETFAQIDTFHHENRFRSRSIAVLELIKLGLKEIEKNGYQHSPKEK